jgi:hypothetical protein
MSTIIRRKRSSRSIGPYKRHELLFGEIVYSAPTYYTGYGNGKSENLHDFISDEMRADWEANRDELMKFWKSGEYTAPDTFPDSLPFLFECGDPKGLPWAAKVFDGEDS